jgi:hypothetical protein
MEQANQKIAGAGNSIFSWEFLDKEPASTNKKFYLIISSVFALLIVYAFWTTNFLFGIFLLLFSFILVLEWQRPPQKEKIIIYQNGVQITNTFYEWKDIEKFSILYVPPHLGKIYFHFKGLIGVETFVPFDRQDPNILREFLKQYLKEDLAKDKENFIDLLRHWLRL